MSGKASGTLLPPADHAALLAGEGEVRLGNAVRLSTEADIALSGQRMRGVLHRLPEGRAAVAAPAGEGPHVEVGIEIDDAVRPLLAGVAQVMATRGFVPAAQHEGD